MCYDSVVERAGVRPLIWIATGLLLVFVVATAVALYMTRCFCPFRPLVKAPAISPESVRAHVQVLAGEIGERNVTHSDAMERAREYIEQNWVAQGYRVARQTYKVRGVECTNVEVTRGGRQASMPMVLVGAHYESAEATPGANDNASGVAAMLEISRYFAKNAPVAAVRFVAFVDEEPPFFRTGQMGSRVYAKMARARGDKIRVMISLETIGYYTDNPGSQQYPAPLNWFYPDRGNFIGFVSNFGSRSIMHGAVAAFRGHSDFPVQCCATWSGIPGIDWSDHGAFWHEGYPAFMATDTAPYRYPHYHMPTDTPDKVDYAALARVSSGLCGVVSALADGS
ncbi:MAG: M28 family peptidase [Acidobacteriota bacterium]